jgi:hypothetical protein
MVVDRPGLQIQLAEEILKLGKPTILVLIHGGAMSLGPLKEKYTAIVDAFYGGEMGGENPFKPAYRFIFVSCCFLLFSLQTLHISASLRVADLAASGLF